MKKIEIYENGIHIAFQTDNNQKMKSVCLSAFPVCCSYENDNVQNKNMLFDDFVDTANQTGRKIEISMKDTSGDIKAILHFQFFKGISVVQSWITYTNIGNNVAFIDSVPLIEYQFCEMAYNKNTDIIFCKKNRDDFPTVVKQNIIWKDEVLRLSSDENSYLGILRNHEKKTAVFWQTESSDFYACNIYEIEENIIFSVTDNKKIIKSGESISTVKTALGVCINDAGHSLYETAIKELTLYRRKIRRKSMDNERLPIISEADINIPENEDSLLKYFMIIDSASEMGFEIFCIGHYKDTQISDSETYKKIINHIRTVGMLPGIHLSSEQFKNEIIEKIVSEYKINYIKTEFDLEAVNDKHIISDDLFERYPKLTIENSSFNKTDYDFMSNYQIHSYPCKSDFFQNCKLSVNMPMFFCPEQSAVVNYLLSEDDKEYVVFNMITSMLMRINRKINSEIIDYKFKDLVKEAFSVYRKIRSDIKSAIPFYETYEEESADEWFSFGMKLDDHAYIAVWRKEGKKNYKLPLCFLKDKEVKIRCLYPSFNEELFEYDHEKSCLNIEFKNTYTARLFRLDY